MQPAFPTKAVQEENCTDLRHKAICAIPHLTAQTTALLTAHLCLLQIAVVPPHPPKKGPAPGIPAQVLSTIASLETLQPSALASKQLLGQEVQAHQEKANHKAQVARKPLLHHAIQQQNLEALAATLRYRLPHNQANHRQPLTLMALMMLNHFGIVKI